MIKNSILRIKKIKNSKTMRHILSRFKRSHIVKININHIDLMSKTKENLNFEINNESEGNEQAVVLES